MNIRLPVSGILFHPQLPRLRSTLCCQPLWWSGQALLPWSLWPSSLPTPTGPAQGPIPKRWSSLRRILSLPSSRPPPDTVLMTYQLKPLTPVQAGDRGWESVYFIDFWMVLPRISQVSPVQLLPNWIHRNHFQIRPPLILCSWPWGLTLFPYSPLGKPETWVSPGSCNKWLSRPLHISRTSVLFYIHNFHPGSSTYRKPLGHYKGLTLLTPQSVFPYHHSGLYRTSRWSHLLLWLFSAVNTKFMTHRCEGGPPLHPNSWFFPPGLGSLHAGCGQHTAVHLTMWVAYIYA